MNQIESNLSCALVVSDLQIYLQSLEKEHNSISRKIKRKRTEIQNFVKKLKAFELEMFQRVIPATSSKQLLDSEIHQIFQKILSERELESSPILISIREPYEKLQSAGLISVYLPPGCNHNRQYTEANESHQQQNHYHSSSSMMHAEYELSSEDEQRIRQLYIKLADIYHPDKTQDSETKMKHTEIMKDLNLAYQEKNLARLLEIEKAYLQGENIIVQNLDQTSAKCLKLEQENRILASQYDQLRTELSDVKKSQKGMAFLEYQKAVKTGADPIQQILNGIKVEVALLTEVRDFLQDYRDRKISDQEFLLGPPSLRPKPQFILRTVPGHSSPGVVFFTNMTY